MLRLKYLVAASLLGLTISSANAVTFDVTGTDGYGDTLTGTMVGDAGLTYLTSINFNETGQQNPFTTIFSYSPYVALVGNGSRNFWVSFSFAGGPTPSEALQMIDTTYSNGIANVQAAYDPTICGADPICQAIILSDQAAGLTLLATLRNYSLVASAVAETPLPAALPLFASGLGALGLLGWRRKRKAQAA